jgi:hypothetical protein
MPKLELKFRNEARQEGPYLVYFGTDRFFGRVQSSNRKQGVKGLVELIKSEIRERGFYDPDLLVNRKNDDVS